METLAPDGDFGGPDGDDDGVRDTSSHHQSSRQIPGRSNLKNGGDDDENGQS
jgi:hypothetical protein